MANEMTGISQGVANTSRMTIVRQDDNTMVTNTVNTNNKFDPCKSKKTKSEYDASSNGGNIGNYISSELRKKLSW